MFQKTKYTKICTLAQTVPLRVISWLQLCTAHPYETLLFQQVSQLGTPLLAPQTISKSLHSERPTGPKPRCRKDETSRTPTQKQYVSLNILCIYHTYLSIWEWMFFFCFVFLWDWGYLQTRLYSQQGYYC